jgi:hypothetical protein
LFIAGLILFVITDVIAEGVKHDIYPFGRPLTLIFVWVFAAISGSVYLIMKWPKRKRKTAKHDKSAISDPIYKKVDYIPFSLEQKVITKSIIATLNSKLQSEKFQEPGLFRLKMLVMQ